MLELHVHDLLMECHKLIRRRTGTYRNYGRQHSPLSDTIEVLCMQYLEGVHAKGPSHAMADDSQNRVKCENNPGEKT